MAFNRQTSVQESPVESGKTPVHQISLPAGKGAQIQSRIWGNKVGNGGNSFTSYSVTYVRRYRDGEECRLPASGLLTFCWSPKHQKWLSMQSWKKKVEEQPAPVFG